MRLIAKANRFRCDRISKHCALVDIFEYLDAQDVLRCMGVNRSFNETIKTNREYLRRPKFDVIMLTCKSSTNNNNSDSEEGDTMCIEMRYSGGPKCLGMKEVDIAIDKESIVVSGRNSLRSVFNFFDGLQLQRGVDIIKSNCCFLKQRNLGRNQIAEYKISHSKTVTDAFSEVFSYILRSIDADWLHFIDLYDKVFSYEHLVAIRDCLSTARRSRKKISYNSITMRQWINVHLPVHFEIINSLDVHGCNLCLDSSIVCSPRILELPKCKEIRIVATTTVYCLDGLRLLVEEMARGTRDLFYLSLQCPPLRTADSALGPSLDDVISILPTPFRLEGHIRDDFHGTVSTEISFSRQIDKNRIRMSYLPTGVTFTAPFYTTEIF